MRKHHQIWLGWKFFWNHILGLFTHPIFIVLTIIGNSIVLIAASLFYKLEFGINPNVNSFLDALWWAVATVTTVGYGEIVSSTNAAKILDIFLMISGTALFLSYTALFASVLLGPAMEDVENEIKVMEKNLLKLKKEVESERK